MFGKRRKKLKERNDKLLRSVFRLREQNSNLRKEIEEKDELLRHYREKDYKQRLEIRQLKVG